MDVIRITLHSDLCAGNGESRGNAVDTDIVLTAAGLPVSLHLSPGLGHGIDRMGLVLGLRTIAEALDIELPHAQ